MLYNKIPETELSKLVKKWITSIQSVLILQEKKKKTKAEFTIQNKTKHLHFKILIYFMS